VGPIRWALNLYSPAASCFLEGGLADIGLASLTFPLTVMNRPEIQKTPDGHPELFWGKIEVRRGYNTEVQFLGQGMCGRGKLHSHMALQVSRK
jgi:hypothetical protein